MTTPYPINLYNTFTRSVERLAPLKPGEIGLYCCGPTVYSYQHIGNFKTFIFEDILVRTLRLAGYKVNHVMNITDVGHLTGDSDEGEDKMALAAKREKKSSHDIAKFYTDKFFEDWDKLRLERPTTVCKATDHIREMIELIKRIEERGFAYVSNGNVYFDVSKFRTYGKLAKLDLEKLIAGARIEVDPNKRNAHDFVLWFTKSKFENQELQWDSPWGRGYPGWHIECSAMSIRYLGEEFDIHCGGIDHIPVHHTNEIAQSEAATGKEPWVKIWMHSQFINLDDEKMSKSLGNVLLVDDLEKNGFEPAAYRMLLLGANYRAHINFNWDAMQNAQRNLQKLKDAVLALRAESQGTKGDEPSSYREEFMTALASDLNTPQALATVWKLLGDKTVSAPGKLAFLETVEKVFALGMDTWKEVQVEIPAEVQKLLEARIEARKNKEWKRSDEIRDQIAALGFKVEDGAGGMKVKPA